MASDYPVPQSEACVEHEVKKSRFIAYALQVTDREQALAALESKRESYPDARHICWAYQIGNPSSPTRAAMSDDGEPSGTAGKPILNVIQHSGVGDLMILVVRYFGGIKLGAGGLVRAYSSAAQSALDHLQTEIFVHLEHFDVLGDFSLEQPLRHWLSQHDGQLLNVNYGQQIRARVAIKCDCLAKLQAFLAANSATICEL